MPALRKTDIVYEEEKAKPFLKWAGGKSQLLPELVERLPFIIKSKNYIENYIEPFIGGGAFFFYLKNYFEIEKSFIFDVNRELILGYKTIKSNCYELIDELYDLQNKYLACSSDKREKVFYEMREKYNHQIKSFDYYNFTKEWIIRVSMLIFLNKTCFNGLYRQNKSGCFNVPFGGYTNPKICDNENIEVVSRQLQNTEIFCADFSESEKCIRKNSFIYFDPPYRPLNKTSSFTDYSKEGFTDEDQKRLAKFYKLLNKKNAYLMLSNSDSQDDFFQKLYNGFKIDKVMANRMINCNGNGRGKITELIITNY